MGRDPGVTPPRRSTVASRWAPRNVSVSGGLVRGACGEGERVRLRVGDLRQGRAGHRSGAGPEDVRMSCVNAADDYAEAGIVGGRIRVLLRRKGVRAVIAIDDAGRGMTTGPALRRWPATCSSRRRPATTGRSGRRRSGCSPSSSSAVGATSCHGRQVSDETWTLALAARARRPPTCYASGAGLATSPGTTVFISELDAEVGRVLTQRKVVDYLAPPAGRRSPRGAYEIEVVEGSTVELVTPGRAQRPADCDRRPRHAVGQDRVRAVRRRRRRSARRVAVVGRAGTTIIDDLAELDEFTREPWTSGQLSGRVSFEPLRQTAGRRAILRDDEVFPVFRDAVRSVEPIADRAPRTGSPRRGRGDRRADGRRPAPGLRPRAPRARRSREPDAHAAR